ncbi:MAG TPA: biotin/lipoyl-containing protein, partial [Pseudonocardiaceae bacterium]|nr:biotin/lipoyl-containing protein [Pseudonocardiaceae bacterium]
LPDEVTSATFTGHAIEARLYAEDTAAGYLPTSGDLHTFEIDPADGLRVDAGFASHTRVSTYYDSMLAKVIGHGPTREHARQVLAASLARARLHGVVTNRDLLVDILRADEFRAGAIDTGYLDRHPPAASGGDIAVHALAAALAGQAERRAAAVLVTLPSGWRNNPSASQYATYDVGEVSYRIDGGHVRAAFAGVELPDVVLHNASPTEVDLEIAGVRRRVGVLRVGAVSYVDSVLGHSALTEVDRFPDPSAVTQPGSLLAPMPGTVVRVTAAVGDTVAEGAPILAIEAMKMEHTIHAPAAGTVTEIAVAVGAQVDSGSVLAVLEEEPSE